MLKLPAVLSDKLGRPSPNRNRNLKVFGGLQKGRNSPRSEGEIGDRPLAWPSWI